MTQLVIGVGGFVGDYLVQAIQDNIGGEVVATKLKNSVYEHPGVEVVDLDILDPGAVQALVNRYEPEHIFHLAAQSSVALAWKNPGLTTDVNVTGSLNLLNALQTMKQPARTLIVGSGEEYGSVQPSQLPIKENTFLAPGNVYAVTKACQNMLASVYNRAYGLPLIMVRAFNHIGPKQLPQFVVADFCKQAVEIEIGLREPVIRVGNLSAQRDFTDVRDVVRAYVLLAEFGCPGETYNVGAGHAVALSELLDRIIQKTGKDICVQVDAERFRPIDVPCIEPDISKLLRDTGWQPRYTLDKSLDDIMDYWRNELRRDME